MAHRSQRHSTRKYLQFRIRVIMVGRVQWISILEHKKIFSGSPTDRESATAFDPDGVFAEPILNILSDCQGLKCFNTIKGDEGVDKYSSHIIGQLAYPWVEDFHQSTISRTSGKCQFLRGGFDAHINKAFVGFCKEKCIILYF